MTGSLVQTLATALLHSLWQGAVIIVGYVGWARALRRGSPAIRASATATTIALVCGVPVLDLIAGRLVDGPSILLPLRLPRVGEAAVMLTPRWATLVVVAWAAGAATMLARIAVGIARTRQLRRSGRAVELPRLGSLARAVGLARVPHALVAACDAPCVVGWLRPALVVPAGLAERLSSDELDAIVLHELAHLRRRDTIHHLALRFAAALAWHQLALRWLFRHLGHERELCCDELAVRAGGGPRELARALVALEERRSAPLMWAAASTAGRLSDRVMRLLATEPALPAPRLRSARAWLGVAAVMLLGAAVVGASVPRREPPTRYVIAAHDPAGPFTVELAGERLVAATIAGRSVPAVHIRQVGRSVRLLGADGGVALAFDVTAPGTIRWNARPASEAP
jgi:bla regulator protein blaR1